MPGVGIATQNTIFRQLSEAIELGGLEEHRATLEQLRAWAASPRTHVVVCGEFNRGKSSLVNALLGEKLCPVDALPETALPYVIGYGTSIRFTVHDREGSSREISTSELSTYSAKQSAACEHVRYIAVDHPASVLADGVVLIDTPGVNDLSGQGSELAYGYLPFADMALVLLDSTAPVTRSEADFINNYVLPSLSHRLIFVLAKCDRLDDEELQESIEGARIRLCQLLGYEPEVIPFSASLRYEQTDERLGELKQKVKAVAASIMADRAKVAVQRACQLATDALGECEARLQIVSLDKTGRSSALVHVEAEKTQLLARVERCRDFTEMFGKETLRKLISESLATLKENVEAELLHSVDVANSRVEEFVRKEAPYRIAASLRHWSNAKSGEIHTFLTRLADRVSSDYAKAFGTQLKVQQASVGLNMPCFSVITESADSGRMKSMIKEHLLPAALPMLAGYILLGPLGIMAGSFLGKVAEFGISEKELSRQRCEARTVIPQQVDVAFSMFQSALYHSLDQWFSELQTLMEREAEVRAQAAEARWLQPHEETRGSLVRAASDLRQLITTLEGAQL